MAVHVFPMTSKNTKANGYKCDVCQSVFASKRTFNYHQERNHLDWNPTCDMCGLSMHSDTALMVHKKIHLWEKEVAEERYVNPMYECSVCDVQVHSPRTLVFHYQDTHPLYDWITGLKKPKKKSMTRFTYDENQNIIFETETETDDDLKINKVKCPVCLVYYNENRIKGHLMMCHPLDRNIFCTCCAAIIVDKQEMQAHLMEHTNGGELSWCSVCDTFYTSAESFETHRRLHGGQRPYACSICNHQYESKRAATVHFYSHLKIEMLREASTQETFQQDCIATTPQRDENLNQEIPSEQKENCYLDGDDPEELINVWD